MTVNHFDTPVMIDQIDTTPATATNYFCFGIGSDPITSPTGPQMWGLESDTSPTAVTNAGSLCMQKMTTGGRLWVSTGTGWELVLDTSSAVTGLQATAAIAPNATRTVPMFFPQGCTITGIRVLAGAALSSASGTITLAIQNGAGTTLLSTATVDAETFVANTLTALTLTATTGNLVIGAGGHVNVILVSNNADAVGGDLLVQVDFA